MKVERHRTQRTGREKQKKVLVVKKSKERVSKQGRNKQIGKGGTVHTGVSMNKIIKV